MAFSAGHEDETAGLVLDEAFEPAAFFGSELTIFLSDIAEKDDIVLGKFVETFGELLDVIFVAAAWLAEAGMKEETGEADAGIARQSVAEVTVFPARVRFDEEGRAVFLRELKWAR